MTTLVSKTRAALAVCVALVCLALSAPALALDGFLETLPGGHDAVMAVDVDATRNSPFFSPALGWMRSHPTLGPAIRAVEEALSVRVDRDIHELAILSNSPPLNLAMLGGGALSPGDLDLSAVEGSVMAVRGDFKANDIIKGLTEESGAEALSAGEVSGVRQAGHDMWAVSGQTMLLVTGESGYRDRIRTRLGKSERIGASFLSALAKLGQRQGVVMMIKPKYEGAPGNARFAALGIRLEERVLASVVMTLQDDESAKRSAEEMAAMRRQALSNPMIAMFGLAPAAQNMAVRQQASDLFVTTSMTNAEASTLLDQVLRIIQTSGQLERGASPASPATPAAPEAVPEQGVEADFN
ncbi:hypothetical protein DL240_03170 [Lujinxingia litoralis]|uniref:DUF3352 domain-containing protein n=1 Tax=Lujinxingia litoralis TaxID=2211119 RepID=A0A328CC19_9DELT|nr:hypothetical protein [Lujinxingia litoralis]RAL25226.1 hypothetical protein DL240_03170 [Lujinxingia litoralis]